MFNRIQAIVNILLILIMLSVVYLARSVGDKGYFVLWLYGGPIVFLALISLLITYLKNRKKILSFAEFLNIIMSAITIITFIGIIVLGLFFNIYIIG